MAQQTKHPLTHVVRNWRTIVVGATAIDNGTKQ